jgi:hypothetical protein
MTAADAKIAATAARGAVHPLYLERAKEIMGLALGAGVSIDDSAALVGAKLEEWDKARRLAAELFGYLDREEESDEGRAFHPVSFGCCRAMWMEDLNRIMRELKETTIEPDSPLQTGTV